MSQKNQKKSSSLHKNATKKKRVKRTNNNQLNEKKNNKKKMNQKNSIKYSIIIGLLIFVSISAGYYYHQNSKAKEQIIVAGDFLPEGKDAKNMSEKDLKKYAQKAADASEFNMVIAPDGTINLTDMTGNINIQNPTNNGYPISVDLIDDKTSQVIYKSGSIQPGQEVTKIKIEPEIDLAEGDVKTTAVFSIYDPESRVKQGELNAEVTLKVKK